MPGFSHGQMNFQLKQFPTRGDLPDASHQRRAHHRWQRWLTIIHFLYNIYTHKYYCTKFPVSSSQFGPITVFAVAEDASMMILAKQCPRQTNPTSRRDIINLRHLGTLPEHQMHQSDRLTAKTRHSSWPNFKLALTGAPKRAQVGRSRCGRAL